MKYNTIHTIPYNTIPYHTIPYHTIQYATVLCLLQNSSFLIDDSLRLNTHQKDFPHTQQQLFNTIQHNTIHTIQYHTIPCKRTQCNTIQYATVPCLLQNSSFLIDDSLILNTHQKDFPHTQQQLFNTIQHNTIQCNNIPYHAKEHNTIQYATVLCLLQNSSFLIDDSLRLNTHQKGFPHTQQQLFNTIQHNTIQYMQYHTIPYHTIPCKRTQYNMLQSFACFRIQVS
jgi:K+ transporter